MIKVLFVCHGNICRSTMAQCMFQDMVNKKGLSDRFYIDSAATSREEIGNGPHYGTVQKLREVGIPVVPHRARQMTHADYDNYDYLSRAAIRTTRYIRCSNLQGSTGVLRIPGIRIILMIPIMIWLLV